MDIAKYIDHTNLKTEAKRSDIEKLCYEAKKYNFATVCVNASWVNLAKILLVGTDIGIACVVGFPLGATTTETKVFESISAVKNGATEIDMVVNVGLLLGGELVAFENDIKKVVTCAGVPVKVILETCKLSKSQIAQATIIADSCGAAFIKTSTGFGGGGATVEDVAIMKQNCKHALVKASGGIRDFQTAIAMIEAGADRLGTSAGVEIVEASKNTK